MTRFLFASALLFLFAVGSPGGGAELSAADQAREGKAGGPAAMDYTSLVERLRAAGESVEAAGEVEQPFLSITGRMIKLHGEDVQVFEYPQTSAMEAQAARISHDGDTVGTTKIQWIGSPHFYKRGKLLVLYVGDEDAALKVLQSVLGPQFAGK